MSFKVSEREFTKTVGRVVTVDEQGKRKTATKTTTVKLQVPQLEMRGIGSVEDIATASKEILALGLPGFKDISSFVEIFNVGAVAALQKSLRTGTDVRRSQNQNKIFQSYLELTRMGAMTPGPNQDGRPDALELLARANMADARDEFLAAFDATDDGEESDADDGATPASNTQRSA